MCIMFFKPVIIHSINNGIKTTDVPGVDNLVNCITVNFTLVGLGTNCITRLSTSGVARLFCARGKL